MINRQNEQRCFRVKERSSILSSLSNNFLSQEQNGEITGVMTKNLFLAEMKQRLNARDLIFSV
jgi:hypothetical protein